MLRKMVFGVFFYTLMASLSLASSNLPVLSGVGGNFKAVDMYGNPMQLDDYKGKVVILGFGYTNCPDICPFTLGYLSDLYKKLPKYAQKNTQVLFITIDPKYDTPAHLKDFISYFNQDFIGITGQTKVQTDYITNLFKIKYKEIGSNVPIEDIRIVVKKQNNKIGDDKVRLYDHSVTIYLLDTDGEVRNISYTGTPKEVFITDILSLVPKSAIKIENFRLRKTAKNTRSIALYGSISNMTNKQDVLLSLSSSIAKRTELHEIKIVEGFARMAHKSNQILKPNQILTLKPMSYHIMLTGLKQPLSDINTIDVIFKFKYAGNILVKVDTGY
ncbi:SCO family protein [Candidatus Thioglobus sp.]|uniref:SCO family protein n=1 Tax=Candidatus Thioglobus sp. TaxID=2026721 RepID=UPI003D112D15